MDNSEPQTTDSQTYSSDTTNSNAPAGDDTVTAVDLFCGAGGLSMGLALACEQLDRDVELVAVNHWTRAIETHERNHPWATRHNAKVEELHPPDVVDGPVDILVGGPECTHFSTARGGKPVNEQKRTSPWHVLDWIGKLNPKNVLIENVREFASWGPVDDDGKPSRDGTIFERWRDALASYGYSVEHRVLNAADFGDATSRKRLFVVARRDNRATFPDPTHSEDGAVDGTEPWRPAADIVDWSDTGSSIWRRDRPLVNNTMQRIAEGLRRYCADDLEPFADAVAQLGKADVESLQESAVAPSDVEAALADRDGPLLVRGEALDPADDDARRDAAFVLGQQSQARARSVTECPCPTIATRGAISLLSPTPFVLPRNGSMRGLHSNAAYDPDERPLHTVTASNHDGHVVSPYLVPYFSERSGQRPRTHDIDDPVPTITATGSDPAVLSPYLVQYYGNSSAASITDPLPTVTTKGRFALVTPQLYPLGLDIHYRMLQPRELSAAMGFPDDYHFVGNKTETTEQIGNSVPVNLATALIRKLLTGEEPSLSTFSPTGVEADD